MPGDRPPGDPSPLKSLLGSAATRFGLDDALATGSLWKRWPDVVGNDVAAHAQPTSLRGGVLRIRADSPVWAHEIGYLAEEIKSKANQALGRAAVSEVRVWNAPAGSTPPGTTGSSSGAGPARPKGGASSASADAGEVPDIDPQEALQNARQAWLARRREERGSDH